MMRAIRAEKARRQASAERERIAKDAERIRARCQSLSGFVREAWHVLEPTQPYIHGWHIDAICAHLEAITKGTFLAMGLSNRLLINVPPGTMKSLLVSVLWPAWEWGPMSLPGMRFLSASYSETYVKRDSRRMRDLVNSEWYQSLWPEVKLTRLGEASFANDKTGFREGVPFQSMTGGRGDRVIIDDPHSTETAESPAERQRTTRIFRESVPSRVNDPEKSAIVVIMQRLHEDDVSGQIIKLGLGYQHLMLPMKYETERHCKTALGFTDPRSADGELLFPERFPPAVLERDQKALTPYAVAGQYQQRPVPREGGLFKRDWFNGKIIRQAATGTVWVRHWDLAATKKATAARTAGVKIGRQPDGSFVVGHVVKTQDEGNKVRTLIKGTAEVDGKDIEISLPQDPGQAGKVQAQDMIAMLAGWKVRAEPETGDKVTRAEPFSSQCEAGNVYLIAGDWNEDYLDELCLFPGGSFKDQVDASSGAFGRLLKAGRTSTALFGTYGTRK
ncbi:terminase [Phyllobacterium phragmitis]|uniref:Terminase n=2 Tax=Phyllobacterium phragmitis TaxID=2670329 RepID=A0A2S9INL0_9HYPH|nr:phage terminase large subunit [Phyllobacterium phragmitis]PRD42111.1 terminase [Phyllobacterium phragmitis]